MDLVSSYIWRGVYEAGPSLQPGLTLGIGNFTIAAWGSVDFTSSSYKEADLMLSYRLKNITFHLKDLYDEGSASDRNPQISRNYFHFGADSPHRIEAGIEWQVSRKVPITLSWYTILFGARDVDTRGRRCYSSYVEVAYPFTVKTIDLKTGVGAAPWKTAGEGGAWGIALLASYLVNKEEGETLESFLDNKVFADQESSTLDPKPEGVAGFNAFMERYMKGLSIEKAAVESKIW